MNTFGEATLGELAQALRGDLIRPDDPGYDEARSIWNGAHDRRPALIVRCHGVADVLKAVEFARSEGLPLAVRGGGHSIPGFSTVDGGLVLDLSPMNGIRVDPGRGTVVAQGGCLWRDVDAETQAFGLAVTGGLISSTGIGGFTLGGGIGWLVRKAGLTCDNLIAADIVTADGQYLHTSEQERPELLWALRGGGGNFGVVTSFELRLHEVGPTVFGGLVFYPGEHAEQIMHGFRAATANAPDELSALINMTTAPPAPFLPEEVHGKPIVAVGAMWAGHAEDGDAATRSLRSLAPVITDLFGPMPYTALQGLLDGFAPRGWLNYHRGHHLTSLPDDVIDAYLANGRDIGSPMTQGVIFRNGGAIADVAEDATAASDRSAPYLAHPIACWRSDAETRHEMDWVKGFSAAFEPAMTGGVYLNFEPGTEESDVRAGYGDAKLQRLAALKQQWDPENLFRSNHNLAAGA